jgi:adenylate cyclase
VLMARSYSAPLTALARQSHRFRDLDLSESEDVPSNLLEVRALAEAHERMRRALDSFSRYVPTDLVRELLTRGEAARIGGRSATLTILFTDLHGFTALSESMSAADLVKLMARYFEVLLESLSRGGATIDKLLGDGLIGFWGAPRPNEDHAADAVRAVLACRDELEGLHQELRVPGRPPLHTRFGLATGEVVVGNVGSPTRLDYTALGDAVNLAERLEELNREYGTEILAGGQLRAATEGVIHWREVDSVRIRGRSESIPVHEPLGLRGEVSAERLEWARRYEEALALYRSQRFEEAAEVLSDLAGREERSATALRLWIRCLEARDRVD